MSAPFVTPRIRYWAKRVPLNSMPSSTLSTDLPGISGQSNTSGPSQPGSRPCPRRTVLPAGGLEEGNSKFAFVVRLDLTDGHARTINIPRLREGPGLADQTREVLRAHQRVQDLSAILLSSLIDRLDDGDAAVIGVGRIAVRSVTKDLAHPREVVGAGSLQLVCRQAGEGEERTLGCISGAIDERLSEQPVWAHEYDLVGRHQRAHVETNLRRIVFNGGPDIDEVR